MNGTNCTERVIQVGNVLDANSPSVTAMPSIFPTGTGCTCTTSNV